MYADYFGFRELPFNNTPDPRFFYSTPDHEEALASLIYAVKEWKGFVLLTGEIGAGKTLISRMMLRHFGTHISFATINHAVRDPRDLMESICAEFELPVERNASPTRLVRTLHDYLLAQFSQNMPVVLVLDEAQNLPVEGFEQLRMIGNLEADDAKLLQIVILGQPELQNIFLSPQLRQLRQRIFRTFHLPSLSRESTAEYISHRLDVVTDDDKGKGKEIFTSDAIDAIYDFSRGLPRLINTACDNGLLSAYSADRLTIDKAFMKSVIRQLMPLEDLRRTVQPDAETAQQTPGINPPWPPEPAQNRPICSEETTQTQWLAEFLSKRIDAIENRMRNQPFVAARYEPPGSDHDQTNAPLAEPAGLQTGTLARADGIAQRVALIERSVRAMHADSPDAKAAHAILRPLVQQTRTIVGRAEAASQDLQRREKQMQKLSGTVKTVVRDLRTLLDHAHEESARNSDLQRDARTTHDQLVTQSEQSRQLANDLTKIVNRVTPVPSAGQPPALLLKEGSVPASLIPTPAGWLAKADALVKADWIANSARTPLTGYTSKNMQQMLDSTRNSLADLRDIARQPQVADALSKLRREGLPEQESRPTTRLANQVENLLEMIAFDGKPAQKTALPAGVPMTHQVSPAVRSG